MSANTDVRPQPDQSLWQWLPEFFRQELAPYPGRGSLVARMVIAATLSMIVIVTFRIPYGAIGVNCAFILSRENLCSTAKSGFYFILAFAVWAALTPIGARMFASIPITHFLWQGVTAFLCFFFLKTLTNFPLAAGTVVVATATMAIWYLPGPAELNVELTLWQILATAIGALITFLVELVFRSWWPADPIDKGIDERLRAVQAMLQQYGDGTPLTSTVVAPLTQYAVTGTGMLRQQIARNHSSAALRMRRNAIAALVSQSVDLSAAFAAAHMQLDPGRREYAATLARRVAAIRNGEPAAQTALETPKDAPPLLASLQVAIGLLESLLKTGAISSDIQAGLDDAADRNRIFVKDALTNPEYLHYALAGTAASMLCYILYVSLNWPNISTAVTTCVLTALSNIGSSRQKQLLRIVGASIGGFVLGIGSQIFVLPYINDIGGFTLLFAVATGVSAYVATSSPRLSYVGLQMAFAFYLINVTDFSISLDLTIGRDRAVGILFGILAMWFVFERLYTRPAGIEMVSNFIASVRLVADLSERMENGVEKRDRADIRIARDHLSALLSSVNAEADAVLFETGAHRASYLAARTRIRRWLSVLRTIYVMQLPLLDDAMAHSTGPLSHPESAMHSFGELTGSLYRVADDLQMQLDVVAPRPSHRKDAMLARPATQPIEAMQDTVSSHAAPAVELLTTLVLELERDVREQRVFQP